MARGVVDKERVGKAVDALLRWVAGDKEQQRISLLDEDQLLYLVVSLTRVPDKARVNPYKIPIPHPLVEAQGNQEICLIVNDLSRGMLRKEAKQRVLQEGLRVSKVIGYTKLKKNYGTHESRRKLCGSYDLFLVDHRILPLLPQALGKFFYKKKKTPIAVNLSRSQWKTQVEAACNSTYLFLSTGTCSVVKAAKVSQTREEIVENVLAVIEGVAANVPRKWDNILALHLKALDSLALPIYQSAPSFSLKIDADFDSGKSFNSKSGNEQQQVSVTRVRLPDVEEAPKAATPTPQPENADAKKLKKKRILEDGETAAAAATASAPPKMKKKKLKLDSSLKKKKKVLRGTVAA